MINALRNVIATRLVDTVKSISSERHDLWRSRIQYLQWCVRIRPVKKHSDVSLPQISISTQNLSSCGLLNGLSSDQTQSLVHSIVERFPCDDSFHKLSVFDDSISMNISNKFLTKAVLKDILDQNEDYGRKSILYQYMLNDKTFGELETGQTIVVDYSSPNIAKPFHAGHLRSTILGHFISNINEWFGQRVVRINYLGDWGTQFGLLAIGFEKYGNQEELKLNPIQHLFDVYVKINKDADADKSVHAEGKAFFKKMEQGDEEALKFWQSCRSLSIDEYNKLYSKLGISFTHIHGESMYCQPAQQFIERMKEEGLLKYNSKSGVGYVDISEPEDKDPVIRNLVKSDGTTLYITRDVVAALDRYDTFGADKLYYVVENGQNLHFNHLARIIKLVRNEKNPQAADDLHVKFGHIQGMSTRRGEVVFLRDILEEAKSLTLQTMKNKEMNKFDVKKAARKMYELQGYMLHAKTTKVVTEEELDHTSEVLGISAVLIQDLKQYRKNNYKFSWWSMLNFNGDTGIFLQYTHARLNSLTSNFVESLSSVEIDYSHLKEDSAIRLILHLARFDDILLRSYTELESCHLVHYLFNLGRLLNMAHMELYVKDQPSEIAKARLVLYQCAQRVLSTGLTILGIKPLPKM